MPPDWVRFAPQALAHSSCRFADKFHEKLLAIPWVVEVQVRGVEAGWFRKLHKRPPSPKRVSALADQWHEAPPAPLHFGSTLRTEGLGDRLCQALQARDRLFVPKPIRAPFSDHAQKWVVAAFTIEATHHPLLALSEAACIPLRGRGQQPRGAVVSAAMVSPRVAGALRAAVVIWRSVPFHLRGGGSVAVCRSLDGRATHAPAHPAPLARGIASALPSLPPPPQGWRSSAAKARRRTAAKTSPLAKRVSEDLGGKGRIWTNRRAKIWGRQNSHRNRLFREVKFIRRIFLRQGECRSFFSPTLFN